MTEPRRITAAMRPRRSRAELDAPEPQGARLENLKQRVTTLRPLTHPARDWGVPPNQAADDRLRDVLARISRAWRRHPKEQA